MVDRLRQLGSLDTRPFVPAVGRVCEEDVSFGIEDQIVRTVEAAAAVVVQYRLRFAGCDVETVEASDCTAVGREVDEAIVVAGAVDVVEWRVGVKLAGLP